MKPKELLAKLNRLQQGRRFKIATTAVLAVLAIGLFVALLIYAGKPDIQAGVVARELERGRTQMTDPGKIVNPLESYQRTLDGILTLMMDTSGTISVATVVLGVIAGGAVIIWLGLGLTYLLLMLLAAAVALPLTLFEPTREIGLLALGLIPLALAFLVLMQLLRLLLGLPLQPLAIARNVLNEAVRMKISLVFIVLVIFVLALVPTLLNEEQPLRYRVQQWLQYGTGVSYGLLALLTVLFATATVSFEQRERVIWQTMTKPVPAWSYILGKWVGVMGLNAVLLTVVASGSYLFTEFLRRQPAAGEIVYNIREDGVITTGQPELMTDDRRILETQVLTARVAKNIEPISIIAADLKQAVEEQVQEGLQTDPSFRDTPQNREAIAHRLAVAWSEQFRSVPPGGVSSYRFTGLEEIREDWLAKATSYNQRVDRQVKRLMRLDGRDPETVEEGSEVWKEYQMRVRRQFIESGRQPIPPSLTLKYRINAGSNNPSAIYRVVFLIGSGGNYVREVQSVPLKHAQYLNVPVELISPEGELVVEVGSDPTQNPLTFTFPPDGLQLLYAAGNYPSNFARIMLVMWVKLGFLAAVAIAAASFLSFPVACLVTLGVLFMAESAGFLAESLDFYFQVEPGEFNLFNMIIRGVGVPISWTFRTYSELSPTESLVAGRLISWGALGRSILVIGGWTSAVLGLGILTFRRRDLATYSGH